MKKAIEIKKDYDIELEDDRAIADNIEIEVENIQNNCKTTEYFIRNAKVIADKIINDHKMTYEKKKEMIIQLREKLL